MGLVVLSLVFGVIAIVLAVISSVLFLVGSDISGAIGVVSTIISTILSVVSIVYTFVSGKQTIKLLDKIIINNNTLVDKIHFEDVNNNFNEENLINIRKHL